MNTRRNRIIVLSLFIAAGVLTISTIVYSHCQIPCGIYDDDMRFKMMAEDIMTVEKSIKAINELSADPRKNMNQIVRWVNNKDQHADKLSEIITYYFMAQRVKPAEPANSAAYDKYVRQLTLLHQMLVTAMKTKQTADLEQVEKLKQLLAQFQAAYTGKPLPTEKPHEHHDH